MQTPNPSPSLAITATPSLLNGTELIEFLGHNQQLKIKALIQSGKLNEKWNYEVYSQKNAAQYWNNEKQQLENYMRLFNKKNDGFMVKYSRHKQKYGRVYPMKSLGLTCLRSKVRNTLIKGLYYDFDLSSAQPSIVYNLCVANGIPCNALKSYCENTKEKKQELAAYFGCEETLIKKLMIRLSFFGTFENWAKENGIVYESVPTFIINYVDELKGVAERVKKENPDLFKIVKDQKEEKLEGNITGSFFSKYLQEYELRIVENALYWLFNNTNICDCKKNDMLKNCIYEYDGIKLLKENVDAFGGPEVLIDNLNRITYENLGFKVQWVEKPIVDVLDVDFRVIIDECKMADETVKINDDYEEYKKDWEQRNCKIIDKGVYVEFTDDGFIIRKRSQLIESYEHLVYSQNKKGEDLHFIDRWLKDNSIKKYLKMDVYPNANDCPPDVLNLWVKFPMELINKYEEMREEKNFLLNHIFILCGRNVETFEYFMLWLAHCVQHPEQKSGICPTFISKEGCGKGSLMILFEKIFGLDKVFTTSDPGEYCWGKFNSIMANSFIVNLDEVDLSSSHEAEGKIKGLITSYTMNINGKNKDAIVIKSYHRWIATTNNPLGFWKTTKDDRRVIVIRSSDELKGNKEYFNKFYDMITNKNVLKTFYEHLKQMPNVPKSMPDKPVTEYQKNLFDANKSVTSQFLEDWTRERMSERHNDIQEGRAVADSDHIEERFGKDIFTEYCLWCSENRLKYETSPTKLGVNIKNLNLDAITKGRHTNYGDSKFYDIKKLASYFGLDNLEFI